MKPPMREAASTHYLNGFLAAPVRRRKGSLGYLEELEPLDEEGLGDLLRLPSATEVAQRPGDGEEPETPSYPEERAEILAMIREVVDVIPVEGDPYDIVDELRERRKTARVSPIHGVGYESHGSYMPGTDPKPIGLGRLLGVRQAGRAAGTRWIAVVDSGISNPTSLPSWLTNSLEFHPLIDVETYSPHWASHGTFIAGMMRQLAPSHGVSMARARPVLAIDDLNRKPLFWPHYEDIPMPTTELHVLEAVARLILRHRRRGDSDGVTALNLSLGAHARPEDPDPFMIGLEIAVDLWRAEMGDDCPIFAAGGNQDDPRPIYPAALDGVRGVGATPYGGRVQVVWDDKQHAIRAGTRRWISDAAPGADVVSLEGMGENLIEWSGSSFASAAAASAFAEGRPSIRSGGIDWWS